MVVEDSIKVVGVQSHFSFESYFEIRESLTKLFIEYMSSLFIMQGAIGVDKFEDRRAYGVVGSGGFRRLYKLSRVTEDGFIHTIEYMHSHTYEYIYISLVRHNFCLFEFK